MSKNIEREARNVSAKQQDAQVDIIATLADAFFTENQSLIPTTQKEIITQIVREFFDLYSNRPIRDNSGGTKFNDSLWLYLITRLIEPGLIIESGTHKGHSAWLLRQASPNADMHCFDISHDPLIHREPDVHYYEMDWSEFDFGTISTNDGLCYFDDHTNQARRTREAYDRGFRTLIFDDNRSATTLYGTGTPPVPTIDMLYDESLQDGEKIEWERNGKQYHYIFQYEDTFGAKELIQQSATTPDLAQVTRYNPQSGMTIVKLTP